ncbi:hypothetical protein HYH02_001745 [Chlamydomonas schloesseri]|uniref:Checkpoint protein n=1 Tax=Chlamydomonas schloesseri TaxID=2026947 RepID=A0A835WW43_9CHLO|nr:hypothetical protein HYH02_001745 [Chlamydomonas schloesseri]|eukprot:KAG2453525.1 hypothetical protein HYH02_001745 [Chlamydomonas schloesseri]
MKLKATLTEHGSRLLWKNFLPTIEKFGKTCQVLLGTDEVHFIQTSLNTDGVHVTARFAAETLFDTATYRCQSKHYNLIAFQVEVGLLLRVLKGAAATNAHVVDVKLTIRQVTGPAGEPTSKPFLSFTASGASTNVVQDVPIGRPYSPAEVSALVAAKDVGAYCPAYVDLVPGLAAAQAIVDRLKAVDECAMLAVCRGGDAHLLVQTTSVALGAQIKDLPVYPHTAFVAGACDRSKPVSEQLRMALENGTAVSVHVLLKQLARVISTSQLTEPAQVLLGIGEGGGHVHVLHVFRDPHKDDVYDDNVTLAFKLPVRDS